MGCVFKARELSVERIVAIKFVQFPILDTENSRKRFEREASIMSGLSHPNIITFYRFGRLNCFARYEHCVVSIDRRKQKLTEHCRRTIL